MVPRIGFNPTRSTSILHMQAIHTHTKMNLSTVKWAQWDKTQSRELLGLVICVCIALCTIVAHNTAQNRPDNFPSCPPDNHHCSDDVYLRETGGHRLKWQPLHISQQTNSSLIITVVVWHYSNVSGCINEVTLHWPRLVLRWVTIFGRVNQFIM